MKPVFIIHYEDIYYSHSEFKKMPVHLLEEYPESIDLMEMIEFLSDNTVSSSPGLHFSGLRFGSKIS